MSQENVERVREAVEAMNSRNIQGALKLAHPDVEWQTLDVFPDAGSYRGPEGVLSFFQTWLDTFRERSPTSRRAAALTVLRVG